MTDAAAHIRRIFLDPKDVYSDADAAEMLGMELLDLNRRMESGEIEGVRTCCGMTVSREEIISFAMDFWPQEMIEEALGDDLADAIPELLRLASLEVRLPRFEIVAVKRLAERDAKSVNAVLARELLDVVSANSGYLSTQIRGFKRALHWPR
jgi:hypothetical protein